MPLCQGLWNDKTIMVGFWKIIFQTRAQETQSGIFQGENQWMLESNMKQKHGRRAERGRTAFMAYDSCRLCCCTLEIFSF